MDKEKPYVFDGVRMSKDEYNKMRFDSFLVRVGKGQKDKIKAHAESKGMSLNAYINSLIEKDMNL